MPHNNSVYSGQGSEWEAANSSPYIDLNHWASGYEKDASIELEEANTLSTLRQISSKLVKNNFIAYGVIQAFLNAIIGGPLVIKIVYPDKEVEKKLNELLKSALDHVDINKETNFEQLVEMMITGAAERGDILINLIKVKGHGVTDIVPELIEASRIFTPSFSQNDTNVRNGVKYDDSGKIEWYYVRKLQTTIVSRPDTEQDFLKIKAFKKVGDSEVRAAYLFQCPMNIRPDQGRQVPLLTPIMGVLRYQAQYFEAVLISARVAACFVGVMQTDNPQGSRENLRGATSDGFSYTKMRPGMLMQSKTGKGSITFSSPNRPSDNQDSFLKRISLFISMALRMPYINLYLDLSEANYSNYRGGSLEVARTVSRWHSRLKFIATWYIWNILKGFITDKKIRFSLKRVKLEIHFPEFKSLDPEKSRRAEKQDIENKVSTPEMIAESRQIDFDSLQVSINKQVILDIEQEALRIKTAMEISKTEGIDLNLLLNQKDEEKEGRSDGLDTSDSDANKREARKRDGNF